MSFQWVFRESPIFGSRALCPEASSGLPLLGSCPIWSSFSRDRMAQGLAQFPADSTWGQAGQKSQWRPPFPKCSKNNRIG